MDKLSHLAKKSTESDDVRIELGKSLVSHLKEQIMDLKEEISFLKSDAKHKNSLLTFFMSQNFNHLPDKEVIATGNDSSINLDNLRKGIEVTKASTTYENVTVRKKQKKEDKNLKELEQVRREQHAKFISQLPDNKSLNDTKDIEVKHQIGNWENY